MKLFDSVFGQKKDRPEDGNPKLVQAMHEIASSDDPHNRKKLYEAFLESMLLIPVPEIPAGMTPGLQTIQTPLQLKFIGLLDRNQHRITPAFTDVDALRNWDPNTPYLGLKARELFRAVIETDFQAIVINPFDPIRKMIRPGGTITRRELEFLAQGAIPKHLGPKMDEHTLQANESVMIGIPAERPNQDVEEALRNKALEMPEIEQLYLFQMAMRGESRSVIGIRLKDSAPSERQRGIVRSLGDNAQRKIGSGNSLDFLILQGAFGEQIRSTGILIYQRQGKPS